MKTSRTFYALLAAGAAMTVAGPAGAQFLFPTSTDTNKPQPRLEDFLKDKTLATGRGFEVKQSELDQAMINAKANYGVAGQQLSASQLSSLEIETLDSLILVRMLNDKATPEQKKQGQESADKTFAESRKQAQTEEAFLRQLKSVGLTPESFHEGLVGEKIAHYVMASRVKITDEQVKKFYEETPKASERPEQALIYFIQMGAPDQQTGAPVADDVKAARKKQLEDLRERAIKGEDFSKLATEFSEHRYAKQSGGEMAVVRGANQGVPPEFETATFLLQTNEISPVITTASAGYFVIKLKEKAPARKDTLAEMAPRIHDYLENREIEKLLGGAYQELKKEYGVQIVDPRLQVFEEIKANLHPAAPPADSPVKTGDK